MKILQLLCFPLYGSGSGTYARKLCEKMALLGNQVAIAAPESRPFKKVKIYNIELPFFAAFTGHSEYPGCKRYSELTNGEINQLYKAFFQQILAAVEEFRPDIIHVHHASFMTWIANYIKAIYDIPYIVIEHGTGILNASLDTRYLPLTRDALRRSEYNVCVSGDTKRWFLRVFGRKRLDKIRVIPGGVDLEAYDHQLPIKIIDKKYKLTGKKVVIFVGKLTKPKGVEYLIKAAPSIKAEICILGSGDERSRLEQMVEEKKIKNIHFLGYFGPEYIKELREFYRRADVFVCPSIWDEPLGLVVLEAMASGTPVVASKKGGIPLAIKNNVNGILVRARSAKAISQAVNKILNNSTLQQKMTVAARLTVEEKFNWLNIAERYIRISENILNSRKQRRPNKKLPYIDIDRSQLELKGRKLDYR